MTKTADDRRKEIEEVRELNALLAREKDALTTKLKASASRIKVLETETQGAKSELASKVKVASHP